MLYETHTTSIEGTQTGFMARIKDQLGEVVAWRMFSINPIGSDLKDIAERTQAAYDKAKIFVSAAEVRCDTCLTYTASAEDGQEGGKCFCKRKNKKHR